MPGVGEDTPCRERQKGNGPKLPTAHPGAEHLRGHHTPPRQYPAGCWSWPHPSSPASPAACRCPTVCKGRRGSREGREGERSEGWQSRGIAGASPSLSPALRPFLPAQGRGLCSRQFPCLASPALLTPAAAGGTGQRGAKAVKDRASPPGPCHSRAHGRVWQRSGAVSSWAAAARRDGF